MHSKSLNHKGHEEIRKKPMSSTQLETRNQKIETDLRELAQDIVRRAVSGGATAAECVIREGDEFSTVVRLGQVETLKESGSKAIGLRVFYGKRAASTYSSDFSRTGLERMLKSALELAKITSEDPFGGIPDPLQLGSITGDLDLYSADVYSLPGEERITILASRILKAARSKPRPDTRFWPTLTDSSANTSVRIALSPPCPSRSPTTAPSSAITGFQLRAASAGWSRPSTWGERPPSALCVASALESPRPRKSLWFSIPWCPARSSNIFLRE
jgi:hypothetical protein